MAMVVNDVLCNWITSRPWGRNPSWDIIEHAIRELDGQHRSEVSLAGEGEAHLSITGGAGIYLVSATPNNDVFYDLRNPGGSANVRHSVVSGGQRVTVSGEEAVDLETALQAARKFAMTGEFDSSLSWLTNPPS